MSSITPTNGASCPKCIASKFTRDEHYTSAPTGWSDDRMMQAYDLIYEVMRANEDSAAFTGNDFMKLLGRIEEVDELLAKELSHD